LSTQDTATFQSLPLRPELQQAIQDLGFEKPSPIQAQALPLLLETDTDFIGLAATGTGKTVAFTLPLLERINPSVRHTQAIILCPTRELCLQVSGQVDLLGKHMGIRSLAIYGGTGYDEQLRGLRQGATVVVGTPGRMIDHLERGTLKLGHVKIVVLDEADEMISMGFKEDMETILETVPQESSQTWLFSATMSPQVRKVADEFLQNPATVQVNRTERLSNTVQQIGYLTQEKNKPEVLCKLIDAADDFYGVIFCQMKSLVVDLTRYLNERGYKADSLHGDMSQAARESAMQAFRDKRLKILVCTDVASRGLDVKDITHVVNYSLPRELDLYVHRIGRTGRAGKAGIAMSLITPSHRHLANKIEKLLKTQLEKGEVPTRKEIGLKKIARELENFKAIEGMDKALELLDHNWKEAVANMTPQEVAARFLSEKFPWVFSTSFDRPQMQRTPRPEREGISDRDDRRGGFGDDRSKGPRTRFGDRKSFNRDGNGEAPRKGASAKSRKTFSGDEVRERFENTVRTETERSDRSDFVETPARAVDQVPAVQILKPAASKAKTSKSQRVDEIDQNRPFDDGFSENGAPVMEKKPRKKPDFPKASRANASHSRAKTAYGSKEKFFKRRADEPRKEKSHLDYKPRFQKSGFDPLAYNENRTERPKPGFKKSEFGKKPDFGGTHKPYKSKRPFFMKEGSAPPPKFKPRSQRVGDVPPRRSKD
jgi:ATP-dependent RNA helicase DeaD